MEKSKSMLRGRTMSKDLIEVDSLKLENQLCFPLYACSKEIVKKYKPFLDELDLTYTQYIVMMVLWDEKEINIKRLGEILFLDSGTLTPLLKKLQQKGFVTRTRSKEDERVMDLRITQSGLELKKAAASVPEKILECISIDKEEALILYNLLYKILKQV